MKIVRDFNRPAMFLILEGIAYTTVFNLYNPFIQMFAKRMGGNDLHTALLNAIPPLVAIFTLVPLGILIERINRKKQTVLLLIFLMSGFFAAISFIPVLPQSVKVMVYVIAIGFLNLPGALYLTTWQSYFADNFEGSFANRIYTLRSKYSQFAGFIIVLATGVALTYIPKSDAQRIVVYRIFYLLCFSLTLIQLYFFSKVKGKESAQRDASIAANLFSFSLKDLSEIFTNKKFIIFCGCSLVFHFSWQVAWPVVFIYHTQYASLNELQLSILSVFSGFAQFITFSFWSKLIEKKGNDLIITIGAAGFIIVPLVYSTALLSFPVIVFLNAIAGVFMAGFNLSLFLGLIETLPEGKKTVYVSVFNTLINITGFIAPLVGTWFYSKTNIFFMLGADSILRLLGTVLYLLRWYKLKKKEAA
jgi:MFS family permease